MTDKNQFKELNELTDLEFEIAFIDSICKKLKKLDQADTRTATLLFMHMSVVESLKKYKATALESNRKIYHSDAVNLIIDKGEAYLANVANDETKAKYVNKSLSDIHEITKELLLNLKSELIQLPEYSYLSK